MIIWTSFLSFFKVLSLGLFFALTFYLVVFISTFEEWRNKCVISFHCYLEHVDVWAALKKNKRKHKWAGVHPNQHQHCLKMTVCTWRSNLDQLGVPQQNREYPPPSSQHSASSCFWHCLRHLRWDSNLTVHNFPTYEKSIWSIEGDEVAEQVTDRHNQLEELVETEHLGEH